MLPQFRNDIDPYRIPKLGIEMEDCDDFLEELKAYHGHFHDCFTRKEVRENFFEYMTGQFIHLTGCKFFVAPYYVENMANMCFMLDQKTMVRTVLGTDSAII